MAALLTVRSRPSAYSGGGKAWDIVSIGPVALPGRLERWPTFFHVVLNFNADWLKLAQRMKGNAYDAVTGKPEHNLKYRYSLLMDDISASQRSNYHTGFGGMRFFVVGNDWTFKGITYTAHASWMQFRMFLIDKHSGLNEQDAKYIPESRA